MSKTTVKARKRTAAIIGLISGASQFGYNIRGAYQLAVDNARKLVPSNFLGLTDDQQKTYSSIIRDYGEQLKAGYVLQYLEARGYAKRFGNYDRGQRVVACIEIMGKSEPTSDKSNRRTELEHAAVKAAQNQWTRIREEAGLKPAKVSQQPRKRKATGTEAAPKTLSLANVAKPHFLASTDSLEFWAAVAKKAGEAMRDSQNTLATPLQIRTVVDTFVSDMAKAIAGLKASGHPSTRKARKDRKGSTPVKAQSITAIVAAGNRSQKANGKTA